MNSRKPTPLDFTFYNAGSLALATPRTEAARDWLAAHCPADEDHQYLGSALAIEHRYVGNILDLIDADGLTHDW